MTDVRQTQRSLSQCKICGAFARYSYYGAVVCPPCRMFFKRNAETGQVNEKQNIIFSSYLFIHLDTIEMSF
jgi:uncharacterized Zn finger protein (UPF0148 family)